MSGGMFAAALDRGTARDVGIHEVKFLRFRQSHGPTSIGTQDLAGCTVVMIVSKYGAILAHIAPLPFPTDDAHVGNVYWGEMMDQVDREYRRNINCFPQSNGWIVCAILGQELGLPEQYEVLNDRLRGMGLSPEPQESYTVRGNRGYFPGRGTVFIDGSGPSVYIEDRLIKHYSPRSTPSPPASSTAESYYNALYSPVMQPYTSTQSGQYSSYPAQYFQGSTSGPRWVNVQEGNIWWVPKEQGFCLHFVCDQVRRETTIEDWVKEISPFDNERCWVYTSERTGTKYYIKDMSNIPVILPEEQGQSHRHY